MTIFSNSSTNRKMIDFLVMIVLILNQNKEPNTQNKYLNKISKLSVSIQLKM